MLRKEKFYLILILCLSVIFSFPSLTKAESLEKTQDKTMLNIDYPQTDKINGTQMEVNGWVMSTIADKEVKIYVDGQERKEAITFRKRDDVIKATKSLNVGGIKENQQPGFKAILNLQDLKDGKHTLKVDVISTDGKQLATYTKAVNLQKYNTMLNVDYPMTSAIYGLDMEVNGWVMSTTDKKIVKIYVDGQERKEEIAFRERADVITATKKSNVGGQKENNKPGFKAMLNLNDLADGKHTLKVQVITDKNETLATYTKTFSLKKYNTILNVDYPQTDKINGLHMEVNGWVMSAYPYKNVKIYIDGEERKEEIALRERADVINATKSSNVGGVKENNKPGFKAILNLQDLKDGKHTLKVDIISNEGKQLATYTKVFNLQKYNTILNIDYPQSDKVNGTQMEVNGWAMSTSSKKTIKIYIDGQERKEAITFRKRDDVIKATKSSNVGGVTENPQPGFKSMLNLNDLADGKHTLKIQIINDNGEILSTYTKTITLDKFATMMYIDTPIDNFITGKKTIKVSGWIMSMYKNPVFTIELDGKKAEKILRSAREDVIKSLAKDYGDKTFNPTPGFSTEFDISSLEEGKHTIKITAKDNTGKILSTLQKTFEINRKQLRGIDVSEHQGKIDWAKVKDEIDFAIIRCGYGEDDPKQDDQCYYYNISECEKYGIPYGVYLYSYAVDLEHARSEVNHVIRLLRGKNPQLGIWFDMEDADAYKAKRNVSDQMCRDITYEFCTIMKNKGYSVGIYANLEWFKLKLDDERLDKFPKWVAQWNDKCNYEKDYVIWQYSSKGKINGIQTDVDLDYYYR